MTHGLANNEDGISDSLSGHLIRRAGSKEGKETANPRRECSHIANPRARRYWEDMEAHGPMHLLVMAPQGSIVPQEIPHLDEAARLYLLHHPGRHWAC